MTFWAIVPVKPLRWGKSRLATVLSQEERKDLNSHLLVNTLETAIRRIRAAGKAPGILTPDEKLARRYLELGALFVAVGADVGLLARGSEALAAKFKG